jgi:uncharacterized repeat protein (TIGR03843 family)
MSAALDETKILTALQEGSLEMQGQFLHGSNYTYLVQLSYGETRFPVVYKPRRGEQPLWDFPTGSLARREVAAYLVSKALGWELVPPTIYRQRNAPLGPGSVQQYIEHDPNYHYFSFSDADRQRLQPVALFDVIINNADRKGSHVIVGGDGHLWLIDHGVCFHAEYKLRTVIWDFTGQPVPAPLLEDLSHLLAQLAPQGSLFSSLRPHLSPGEIKALAGRVRSVLAARRFPEPDSDRRSYPWPPV